MLRPYTSANVAKLELRLSRFEGRNGGWRRSRVSIDEIVPTHAATAPAINFALRSS